MKIEEKEGRLVITDFNQLEAYKIACKIEKDGIHFYESLLEKIENESARREIERLLEEERKHFGFFEKHLDELRRQMPDGFEEDDLLSYVDYGVFEPYQSAEEMLVQKIDDAKKALRLGMIIEEKAISFYRSCSDKVSPQTKKELENIAAEEEKHRAIFEKMFQALEK